MEATLKFLVDNDLSPRFATELQAMGHTATHARDLGMASADDELILMRAAQDDRIVVTQDSDFSALMAAKRMAKPSVVYFRTLRKSQRHLVPLFAANFDRFREDLVAGAIVVIEDARIRIRRLPLVPDHAERRG